MLTRLINRYAFIFKYELISLKCLISYWKTFDITIEKNKCMIYIYYLYGSRYCCFVVFTKNSVNCIYIIIDLGLQKTKPTNFQNKNVNFVID